MVKKLSKEKEELRRENQSLKDKFTRLPQLLPPLALRRVEENPQDREVREHQGQEDHQDQGNPDHDQAEEEDQDRSEEDYPLASPSSHQEPGLRAILIQLGQGIHSLQQAQLMAHQKPQDTRGPSLKMEIPAYSGTKSEDLDRWITYLDFILEAKKLKDPDTVFAAVTGLRKEPADWYHALKLQEQLVPLEERQLTHWSTFKVALKAAFGHPQAYDYYLDKLVSLQQGGSSIQTYNSEFSCLVARMPHMAPQDMKALYVRGLRRNTQVEVKCRDPKTWTEAKEMANILETTKFHLKADEGKTFTPSKTYQKSNDFKSQSHNQWKGKRGDSSTQRSQPATNTGKKKFEWVEGKMKCWKCHKLGHKGNECKNTQAEKPLN